MNRGRRPRAHARDPDLDVEGARRRNEKPAHVRLEDVLHASPVLGAFPPRARRTVRLLGTGERSKQQGLPDHLANHAAHDCDALRDAEGVLVKGQAEVERTTAGPSIHDRLYRHRQHAGGVILGKGRRHIGKQSRAVARGPGRRRKPGRGRFRRRPACSMGLVRSSTSRGPMGPIRCSPAYRRKFSSTLRTGLRAAWPRPQMEVSARVSCSSGSRRRAALSPLSRIASAFWVPIR